MRFLAAAVVLLCSLGSTPQEATTVQALVDAVAAVGHVRWNNGTRTAPFVLFLTPSGDTVLAVRAGADVKDQAGPFEAVFRPDSPQEVKVQATFLSADALGAWLKP